MDRFKDNLRWKVLFYKKPNMKRKMESYGLKSKRSAPSDPDLLEFERQLYEMVRNVKFKKVKMTEIEKQMKHSLKVVKQKENMLPLIVITPKQ